MEGLRSLARSSFRDSMCVGKHSDFDTITISTFPTLTTSYQRRSIPVEGILKYVTEPVLQSSAQAMEPASATLQLIRATRLDNESLCISPVTLHLLFDALQLDPSILYLIDHNSYGFHHFAADSGTLPSYFIGTVIYVLIWSFDVRTMSTKALLFTRSGNGLNSGREAFSTFDNILALNQDYAYVPCLLAFIAITQTIRFVDSLILKQLYLIRTVEAYTGHGAFIYSGTKSNDPETILKDINRWSTKVGASLVDAANQQRHTEIVAALIAFCSDPKVNGFDYRASIDASNNCLAKHDTSLLKLQAVLPVFDRQLQSTKQYISYLQERARNQSTVLFGLLTHQDAIINTELAISSTRIAAATKRDGEAMKTIAVMTMLFLPATYFAALFAMPSLHWDQQPVIQDGFRLYWAFTLPATALVFTVWFVLTEWSWIVTFWTRTNTEEGEQVEQRSMGQSGRNIEQREREGKSHQ